MDDHDFRALLAAWECSWKGYRKVRKGVKRRVSRHMQALGCRTADEYLRTMERSEALKAACARRLAVPISRFYRDRGLWIEMRDAILPILIDEHPRLIRAWIAGCACGEEAYTLRMVWEQCLGRFMQRPFLDLTATDAQPDFLHRARQGVYTSSSLKDLPGELRTAYLTPIDGGRSFRVQDELRRRIRWSRHDFRRSRPPLAGLHLVLLRNSLLTYYAPSVATRVLRDVVGAMAPGAFLVIGSHERLPGDAPPALVPFSPVGVFRKSC